MALFSGCVGVDGDRALRRVDRRRRSEWNRPLLSDVADRNSGQTRNAERVRDLAEHFVEWPAASAGIVGTLHALAEYDRPAAVESAREHELLEHSVDSIYW